jgi:hypothetical protein
MRLFVIAVSAALLAGSADAQVPQRPFPEGGASTSVPAAISTRRGADRIPNLNVKKACKESSIGTDACLTDEEAARQMLIEKWSSFAARDKASCYNEMRTLDRTVSYIDLVDCLLMDAHAREPLPPVKK